MELMADAGRTTMLTVLLQMTVKPGREAECAKVAAELTASTRAEPAR
jgi:hypothetical protein